MTTIRAARAADFEAIGELCVRAYAEAGNLPADDIDYATELRNAADRAAKAELLVAVDDDMVLGTVTVARPGGVYAEIARPGEVEFRMLAVAPEAAGRGIGAALVGAVLDRARQEDAKQVVLCVSEVATAAQRLYRRLGFEPMPERDWIPVPNFRLTAHRLLLF
ncbi:GNAT family N-acetyltransferase [Saccharopolyspora sp. CA-218241]|uniref:GNAT family N-acetyltransferase n=1 Tax=Saccharopolyspora sp. CA-218241 TaxID=3240027 RepID=UPI003D99B29B